jgi:iron complex transport system substrate-binding protein
VHRNQLFLKKFFIEGTPFGIGLHYHYICKLFKETYGTSPHAYLLSKRMDHAAHLLSEGQSVSAVSAALGYSSPYNFSRAYKKHFGYPPKGKKRS